jgi:hypothetical protein
MLPCRYKLLLASTLWVAFISGSLRAGESPEQAKLAEFKKAYGTASNAETRRAALGTLAGCQEKATLQMLCNVAMGDKDKDVRAEALSVLAGCPDQDGSLTGMVVQAFQAQRDTDSKCATAFALGKLPMKQPPIQALIAALIPLQYPDLPKAIAVRPGMVDPTAGIEKMRNQFSAILTALNSASGQSFQASRTVKNEINAWWGAKQGEFMKADQEYQKGLKAAAEEKKKADAETKKAEGETKKAEEK